MYALSKKSFNFPLIIRDFFGHKMICFRFLCIVFQTIFKLWENNVRTVTREISIIYSESAKKIFIKYNLWKQDVHVYFSIIIFHFSITIKDCFTINLPLFVRIFNRCRSNIQSVQSQGKPA